MAAMTLGLVRGDDARIVFRFPAGALADVSGAVFTAESPDGRSFQVSGVVDGDSVVVLLTPDDTGVAGKYRADLQTTYADGKIRTPWLAGEFGGVVIHDDVTKEWAHG